MAAIINKFLFLSSETNSFRSIAPTIMKLTYINTKVLAAEPYKVGDNPIITLDTKPPNKIRLASIDVSRESKMIIISIRMDTPIITLTTSGM